MGRRSELEQHIPATVAGHHRKESTMAGIKETKEALVLGFALAHIVKELAKDGLQPSDAVAFAEKLLSDEVVAKVRVAVEGAAQIAAEAGDVDLFEGLELAKLAIAELKKLAA